MNNISQNIRYYPHDLNTKFYAVQLYLIEKIFRHF